MSTPIHQPFFSPSSILAGLDRILSFSPGQVSAGELGTAISEAGPALTLFPRTNGIHRYAANRGLPPDQVLLALQRGVRAIRDPFGRLFPDDRIDLETFAYQCLDSDLFPRRDIPYFLTAADIDPIPPWEIPLVQGAWLVFDDGGWGKILYDYSGGRYTGVFDRFPLQEHLCSSSSADNILDVSLPDQESLEEFFRFLGSVNAPIKDSWYRCGDRWGRVRWQAESATLEIGYWVPLTSGFSFGLSRTTYQQTPRSRLQRGVKVLSDGRSVPQCYVWSLADDGQRSSQLHLGASQLFTTPGVLWNAMGLPFANPDFLARRIFDSFKAITQAVGVVEEHTPDEPTAKEAQGGLVEITQRDIGIPSPLLVHLKRARRDLPATWLIRSLEEHPAFQVHGEILVEKGPNLPTAIENAIPRHVAELQWVRARGR